MVIKSSLIATVVPRVPLLVVLLHIATVGRVLAFLAVAHVVQLVVVRNIKHVPVWIYQSVALHRACVEDLQQPHDRVHQRTVTAGEQAVSARTHMQLASHLDDLLCLCCPLFFVVSPLTGFGSCSLTCGGTNSGTQTQTVGCYDDQTNTLAPGMCSGGAPPPSQSCTPPVHCYSWSIGQLRE